jgi:iron complex transport system substrate-binding protein
MQTHETCLLALLAIALAAPALAYPVTVQSCDREVTFDAPPARAASNDVNLTEMMLVLGLADRMVGYTGISGWNTLDEEMRAGVAELPELSERYPSREVLIGADLDFWFAGWNYGMRVGGEVTPETLAPFGINVYELTESCIHIMPRDRVAIGDMFTDIRNLAAIFGVPERAEALIAGWEAELAEIAAAFPQASRCASSSTTAARTRPSPPGATPCPRR